MMNDLDNKLKSWASSHEPSAEHLKRLQTAIHSDLVRPDQIAARQRKLALPFDLSMPGRANRRGEPSFWSLARIAAMAAAAVALLWIGTLLGPTVSGPETPSIISTPPADMLAAISSQQADGDRVLFTEMNRLFSGQLRWVTRSGGDVDMTLESRPEGLTISGSPTLVRVTIIKRKGLGNWEPFWGVDVLARGEEFVDMANEQGAGHLRIWAHPMEDGKVAMDTDVSLTLPIHVASTGNRVVEQGRPVEIAARSVDGIEYKVFQTVKVL
jgi:hypothetical protein